MAVRLSGRRSELGVTGKWPICHRHVTGKNVGACDSQIVRVTRENIGAVTGCHRLLQKLKIYIYIEALCPTPTFPAEFL